MPKIIKLVIDTIAKLRVLCADESILIVCCEKNVEEFIEVSSREKLRKYVNKEAAAETLELIRRYAIKADVENVAVRGLNDPKDSFLFALADTANVDFLITGDNHLLSLQRHNNTVIISFSDFYRWRYEG